MFSQKRNFMIIAFTDANMYATSIVQSQRLKATVPDRRVWLWSSLHTTLAQITRITASSEYTVLKIFSPFRIFKQLAIALKNKACPENFHCIEYIFYHSVFLSNLVLALKNRVCPENFHCIKYTYFYIQEFRATCAFPEKHNLHWNFSLYWIYIFLSFRTFKQLPLTLKNRVSLKFFTVLKYILSFRIFEQLTLDLKTEFALKCFKSGGAVATPPDPLPRTPMPREGMYVTLPEFWNMTNW